MLAESILIAVCLIEKAKSELRFLESLHSKFWFLLFLTTELIHFDFHT